MVLNLAILGRDTVLNNLNVETEIPIFNGLTQNLSKWLESLHIRACSDFGRILPF